mgnify:CR=1 FL=1
MTAQTRRVNAGEGPLQPIAPLRNVQRFHELVTRLQERHHHLPGWGAFSGPSGRGKTTAAVHTTLKSSAIYVECGSTWTASTLVDALMAELNMAPIRAGVAKKVQAIIGLLSDDPLPMIFDEADHLVKKSLIDVIREISDKSGSPVVLIGETHLPQKLMAFERAHNRVLEWMEAEDCTLADAKALARLYARDIEIADDLLQRIVTVTEGTTRRIVINIDRMVEMAKRLGRTKVALADFMDEIDRGLPPRRKAGMAKRAAGGAA